MAVGQLSDRRLQAAFRVDASRQMGGGHVMRCLTLAARLTAAGVDVSFIAAAIDEPLGALVRNAGCRLVEIDAPDDGRQTGHDWDRASWPSRAQAQDAARTAEQLAGAGYDWLIVDHYGLDAFWEAAMRPYTRRLAVIDDLANRPHDCDLLLDQTYGRDDADYRPVVSSGTELLIGARYALLRPEFALARPAALARNLNAGSVDRVLISLGMTDVGALTEVAARATLAATDADIDIVVGSAAPTIAVLRAFAEQHERVTLHVDTVRVCDLMVRADMAIGAAGTTSWERCCLGLPTVTFAIAGNQRVIAAKLAAAGAVDLIDRPDPGAIERAVRTMSADLAWRRRLAEAAAGICDGEGAARVASHMLEWGRGKWTA